MRKYIAVIFFLFLINIVRSQTDSLKRLLVTTDKEQKVDALLALSKAYWRKNWDSALFYASEALQFSGKINYVKGMAEAYRHVGVINMYDDKAEIAGPYFDSALKLYKQLKDTPSLAATYNNIGLWNSHHLGNYQESIEAYIQAIRLFQKTGNLKGEGSALNYVGINYEERGDYHKAIEYTLQGLAVRKKTGDHESIMFSLTRVGQLYKNLGQKTNALKYFQEALDYALEKKVPPLTDTYEGIATVHMDTKQYALAKKYIDLGLESKTPWMYNLLAEYYMQTGHLDSSLATYEQNLSRSMKGSNYPVQASSMMGISSIYVLQKNNVAALEYAKKAYDIANRYNMRWTVAGAANTLSSLNAQRGNYRQAYYYEKVYRSISDSMNRTETYLKQGFLESKIENQQNQSNLEVLTSENKLKEQQLSKEALIKKIFIIGIVVILLISAILIRNISLNRKNEKHRRVLVENELQIQKLESEKTRAELQQEATELEMKALRAQMNPHFIFNSLNSINRFILQNNRQQASEYLTKFSKLVRMILHNSQSSMISLESELESLGLYIEMEALRFNFQFGYKISVSNDLDISAIQVPPLIIQPYVENAIWHGLMHKEEKGQLEIGVTEENDVLILKIMDDGIGREKSAIFKSKSATTHKSVGLKITADRIAMLHSTNGKESHVIINDLISNEGKAAGTEVIIKMPVIYD